MSDLTGWQLEKYRLDRILGHGAASTVYLAYDVEAGRRCAVKVLSPHLAADPGIAGRFREGGHLAASIQHSNVVRVYRVGEDRGHCFIAMEYFAGGTLERHLKGKPWRPVKALAVLRQVSNALDHVHERGIIHRDIKPNNVLVSVDGKRIALCDFGISQSLLRPGRAVKPDRSGTLAYMSPEQCQGHLPDRSSDVYSLAIVAYQMLTGRLPFYAEEPAALLYQQIRQPPPPPRQFNQAIRPHVEEALLRALAKNPAERYRTAGDFVRALAGERLPYTPQPHEAEKPPARRRPGVWPFFVVLVLLSTAAVAGWRLLPQLARPVVTRIKVVYVTATPTPGGERVAPLATSTREPTRSSLPTTVESTPTVRPVDSSSPTASALPEPALPMAECEHPDIAQITSPRMGQEVTGKVAVIGTAAGPGFVRYELFYKRTDEIGDPHQYLGNSWSRPVIDGNLATWNPYDSRLRLSPGEYLLYLRVVNRSSNYQECAVKLLVK